MKKGNNGSDNRKHNCNQPYGNRSDMGIVSVDGYDCSRS